MAAPSTGAEMASDSQSQDNGDKCFTELTAYLDAAKTLLARMKEERKGRKEKDGTLIEPSEALVKLRLQYQEAEDRYTRVKNNLLGGVGNKEFDDDRRKKSADYANRKEELGEILNRVNDLEEKL
jgi:hypothetical protein